MNIENIHFKKLDELNDTQQNEFFDIMVECFAEPFKRITKDKSVLRELFMSGLDKSFAYVCLCGDKVAGFASVSNNKVRPLHFDKKILQRALGKIGGAMTASSMNSAMGKPAVKGANEAYIDYIGVSPDFRRMGIAQAIFDYLFNTLKYDTYYLDVVYNNEKAIPLYKKIGFEIIKEKKGFVQKVSGLKCEYFMKYEIPKSEAL